MLPKSGLRLIGLQALLVAITIQGVTPCTYSLVSPWVLRWLDPSAPTGHPDARYGRMPENDRPAPLNATDPDEAPDEVVIAGDFHTHTVLSRWPVLPSGRPAWADARPESCLRAPPHRPAAPVTDPISSLCRMTC